MRLRNLGGIIIIDFIDMAQESHREAVLQELAKALAFDRTRVTLHGFTSLGLVELTRKRSRENLNQVLCEPCPSCQGRGRLKTPQTVCYEIQREIVREARRYDAESFRILAAPNVIDLFLDEESQSLAMLIASCQGRGRLKTPQTVCYEIQREIVREARRYDAESFRILAAPNVIDLFLDEESQSLAMLIDFIGKPISLAVETAYTQEQYDIVLM